MSEARNQSPSDPLIPDKLYFRIGEVARLLNVETHTLRFWETEFPQLKVGKGGTGQRLYRRRDVELVFEIKHLLYEQGYTIPGARQFLQNRQPRKEAAAKPLLPPQQEPNPQQEPGTERKLERIRSELRDLSALLTDAGQNRAPATAPSPERNRPASPPPRRGLHLAARSAKHLSTPPPAKQNSPGLFDPDSE